MYSFFYYFRRVDVQRRPLDCNCGAMWRDVSLCGAIWRLIDWHLIKNSRKKNSRNYLRSSIWGHFLLNKQQNIEPIWRLVLVEIHWFRVAWLGNSLYSVRWLISPNHHFCWSTHWIFIRVLSDLISKTIGEIWAYFKIWYYFALYIYL